MTVAEFPMTTSAEWIYPLGARILKAALDYDLYEAREVEKAYIFSEMKDKKGVYDPKFSWP